MLSAILALRISRTAWLLNASHLCPFALWMVLPSSLVRRTSHDSYGHSVPVGLAPGRESRVPSRSDVRAPRRCLTHHLAETSLVPFLPARVPGTATLS